MKKKFCIMCGKKGNFESYICEKCTQKKETEEKTEGVVICKSCGRVFKGKWLWTEEKEGTKVLCGDCKKFRGGYYEAILQLRGFEKELNEIDKLISDLIVNEKKKNHYQYAKFKGEDIYFFNSSFAKKSAKIIRSKFGGEEKITRKLQTYDAGKGKRIYRITICIRK